MIKDIDLASEIVEYVIRGGRCFKGETDYHLFNARHGINDRVKINNDKMFHKFLGKENEKEIKDFINNNNTKVVCYYIQLLGVFTKFVYNSEGKADEVKYDPVEEQSL